MKRGYDATPPNFEARAKEWFDLATRGVDNPIKDFTTTRFVAMCFSVEFLLKSLLCINKDYAQNNELKKYSHKLGKTKEKVLTIVQDQNIKDLIELFFCKYPLLENIDVIRVRYGEIGGFESYDTNIFIDDIYPRLLNESSNVIRKEWKWLNK